MSAASALRIGIVGAGPAGLTMAWFLRRLGFESVEIFEAADRIGGQSHTIDVGGVPVELGTVYLADGYVVAREVADAAGCPAERMPPATFLDGKGHPRDPVRPPLFALLRYIWKWFLWYFRGQMWRPTMEEYTLPFDEWLRHEGLGEMLRGEMFTDGCTAQLYGPLDSVTAQNAMYWVRPSLLLTGRLKDTAHIPAGFENMWKCLIERLGYAVHLGERIDEVRPLPSANGSRVELVRDGRPIQQPFDHVFIACPLDEHRENSVYELRHPLSQMLREDFPPFDATEVYSAVWRARDWPLFAPSRCYLPADRTEQRGRLLTIRQFGKVGDEWVGQLCSYAIRDTPTTNPMEIDERTAANRRRVVDDMEHIVGLRDIRIVTDKLWRYSIRFSEEQLRLGLPSVVSSLQGVDNVWYLGGTLSHWDVDMISNFNQSLAWRFASEVGLSFFTRLSIVRLRDLFRDL